MRLYILFCLFGVAIVYAQTSTLSKECSNVNTGGGCQNCNAPITWLFWDPNIPPSGAWVSRLTGLPQTTTTVVRYLWSCCFLLIFNGLLGTIRTLVDIKTREHTMHSASVPASKMTVSRHLRGKFLLVRRCILLKDA